MKKLFYAVSNETIVKEDHWYFQRFYPGNVVQLRGSENRTEGEVIRSCQEEDGGTLVQFDGYPRVTLHNPYHLESVWVDEEGNVIDGIIRNLQKETKK